MALQTTSDENQVQAFLSRRVVVNWLTVVYIVIFALAVFTRFHELGVRVMSHDESLHTRFSYNLYNDGDFRHTPLMHGPILFHATAFFYALFGDSDFSARIYTAVLGVLMVFSPLLFRRWLGTWGTLIACVLMLISPLLLYYHRYIREDTPAIMAGILMMWAILMYLSGPPEQRRKAHWLYILSAAMIWNLGTKETAFMYVAIIGIFLALYWFVRMAQYSFGVAGKPIYEMVTMGIMLGGVLTLGMYIFLDIINFDLLPNANSVTFAMLPAGAQQTLWLWTILAIIAVSAVAVGTMLWVRGGATRRSWAIFALVFGISMATAFALVVIEEVSHTAPSSAETPIVPAVPDGEGEGTAIRSSLRWTPMVLTWVLCLTGAALFGRAHFFLPFVGARLVQRNKRKRKPKEGEADDSDDVAIGDERDPNPVWRYQANFPEFDVMIIIGTLILPWATALVPYVMNGTPTDFMNLGNSLPPFVYSTISYIPDMNTPQKVGQFWLHFMAWLPMMFASIVIGLSWNWRRWLVAAGIFYAIFVFFFTSVFTNMQGLGTGMVYSLGYWLEQQGVRRGSQPQYYYLLIIMPIYEFLPVIGAFLSMIAGFIFFWRKRTHEAQLQATLAAGRRAQAEREAISLAEDGTDTPSSGMDESQAVISLEASSDEPRKPIDERELNEVERELGGLYWLNEVPFLIFWAWLGVFNLIIFSLAGEKMPWLGTHLTFPLIFLTGWFLGRIVQNVNWQTFRAGGWMAFLIAPIFIVTLAQVVGTQIAGNPPFAGLTNEQLRDTCNYLASFGALVAVSAFLLWLGARVGVAHLRQMLGLAFFVVLGGLTFRAAWVASFVNYDRANEFLVYAHSAPAVKGVLAQIEELSYRTTDGLDLRFAYDNEVSWPYSWYFRHFRNAVFVGANPTVQNLDNALIVVVGPSNKAKVEPILEDRYQMFQHIRMWWPMQDYFNVTLDRLNNLLDFSPVNVQAANMRKGIFDIWWNRDYTRYGAAISKDFSLTKWPVHEAMYVYVRKDVAAQIWEYGAGDGGVVNPLESLEVNQCVANWQNLVPSQVLTASTPMNRPLGVALAPDGRVFVAEEFNHRLSSFNADGLYLGSLGVQGTPQANVAEAELRLNRPNALRFAPDGTLYVVDTWNFRVHRLSPEGERLTTWGQPGTYGFNAPTEPTDAFWGPRDIAISADGRIYIADTGNKRVRVYRMNDEGRAAWLYDIGSGGSGAGQLDEPNGLAIHPDGRLFVADTWNRRVSVFTTEGVFLTSFNVRAWYQTNTGNLPYLALDVARDLLYVTDPDSGRVLVYTLRGECVGSFGGVGDNPAITSQFKTASGIVVDARGFVYVSDAGNNRVLKFPPFPMSGASAPSSGGVVLEGVPAEATAESTADAGE